MAEIKPVKKRPSVKKINKEEIIKKNVELVKKLSGGLNLGKGLTPEQINKLIDQGYEEEVDKMLS